MFILCYSTCFAVTTFFSSRWVLSTCKLISSVKECTQVISQYMFDPRLNHLATYSTQYESQATKLNTFLSLYNTV